MPDEGKRPFLGDPGSFPNLPLFQYSTIPDVWQHRTPLILGSHSITTLVAGIRVSDKHLAAVDDILEFSKNSSSQIINVGMEHAAAYFILINQVGCVL